MDKQLDLPLEQVVDTRGAVLILCLMILFVFVVLPFLWARCLGCGGGNRHPNGVTEDGVPRNLGYEVSGGMGGWDRYPFLTSAKRREVDKARREMLLRCLVRVSIKLDEAHMLRLGECSEVRQGQDDENVEADVKGGGCINANSAIAKRGSFAGRRVPSTGNMTSPHGCTHSEDSDEEAPKRSSLLLVSLDDCIDRIDDDDPTMAAADEEETSTEKEAKVRKGSKGVTQDLIESEGGTQSLMMASNHSLVSLMEYTHIRIPYPGHYRDGTKIEERMPKVNENTANDRCNSRFLLVKKKAQVADEAPAEQGRDKKEAGEGKVEKEGEEGDNDSPKSGVRNKSERRNVPAFCAICLEEYSPTDIISWSSNPACTHVFHTECIVKWLVTLGKRSGKYHRHHLPVDGTEMEEGMKALNYELECPCCRQEFVWKANVLLGGKEVAGEDVSAEARGEENA